MPGSWAGMVVTSASRMAFNTWSFMVFVFCVLFLQKYAFSPERQKIFPPRLIFRLFAPAAPPRAAALALLPPMPRGAMTPPRQHHPSTSKALVVRVLQKCRFAPFPDGVLGQKESLRRSVDSHGGSNCEPVRSG